MRPVPVILVLATALLAVSAGPFDSPDPEELIQLGNDAVHRGDLDAAERLYSRAAERTADPGLVAFNRGTVALARGEVREAELEYVRALDDRAAQPDRRARALYNRGVCLLQRGGTAAAYRTAIACFEQALDLAAADEPLTADARNNLELAKLLWHRARSKEKTPPKPNELPPDAPPESPPDTRPETGSTDPGAADGTGGGAGSRPQTIPGKYPHGTAPREMPQQTPGAGSLPVILDADQPERLSPDEARTLLRQIAGRIEKDRKANVRMRTGPERPHVRDW